MNAKNLKQMAINQDGSILAISLFALLVLSVLGTFALNTADFEINIAANQQEWEKNFNVSEGGTTLQGTNVGYAGVTDSVSGNEIAPWYEISDPTDLDNPLVPPTVANYDPSLSDAATTNDDLATGFTIPGNKDTIAADPDIWPRNNLTADINDDVFDYSYLVTYLYPQSVAVKGYGATTVDAYHFRLNGRRNVHIEMGGKKIGVKSPL